MKEPEMVWAIMAHEYEGSFLVALFSTKEKAEAWFEAARQSRVYKNQTRNWEIEEQELDPDSEWMKEGV